VRLMTSIRIPVAVAYGDGIGPEIMKATLFVLEEAGANIEWIPVDIGEKIYLMGHPTGITQEAWGIIRETRAFLKAPITTPQGGGVKSLNVTIRTTLGLFANIRPCVSYAPFVETKHPGMDVVIIRENEEDLYMGIEYQQTPHMCHSLKCISREGSTKIIRYAFTYARNYGRKKVTCFTKDNILKFSDGLFHHVFSEIAKEFPDIENEHLIVDIGSAKLASTPQKFDVLVLPNLYGDILSDVAAEIGGSVGLVGSANIGDKGAMFEAIHGSAPKKAGQGVANPSALLLSAVLMLSYLGENIVAERIHNAWLKTLEKGIHTYDIFLPGKSTRLVNTEEFAKAVVDCLGEKPDILPPASYQKQSKTISVPHNLLHTSSKRECIGCDIYVYAKEDAAGFLARASSLQYHLFALEAIFNRGVRVWPEGYPETHCLEQWRLRFLSVGKHEVSQKQIVDLLAYVVEEGLSVIRTEYLFRIGERLGYSSAEA